MHVFETWKKIGYLSSIALAARFVSTAVDAGATRRVAIVRSLYWV